MPALVARVFCNFQVSKSEQKNFDQERKKFSETLYSPFFFFFTISILAHGTISIYASGIHK